MHELRNIGFSSTVGIGGDPVVGTTHIDGLAAVEQDHDTELIVLIGEIGADADECAAAYAKKEALKAAGERVGATPTETSRLVIDRLAQSR